MESLDLQVTYNTKYWTDLLEKYLSDFAPDFLDQIAHFPERIVRIRERVNSTEALFKVNNEANVALDANIEQCTHQLLVDFEYPLYERVKTFIEKYHSAYFHELVSTHQLRPQVIIMCQHIRQIISPEGLCTKSVTDAIIDATILSNVA